MNKISNSNFDEYISNISATKTEIDKIISSHQNVKKVIENSDLSDNIYKLLLIGSYKRGTNTKTLLENSNKKIDVDLAVIFKKDTYDNPMKVINKLYELLNSRPEYEYKVSIQSRSIGIELEKTHIDVVPFQQVNIDEDSPLYISKKNKQEWEKTNPICHINLFNEVKKEKDNFTKYVKALKWWKKVNKPEQSKFPIGLAIEVLVSKYYVTNDNLFEGFIKTLENVDRNLVSNLLIDPCNSDNNLLNNMNSTHFNTFKKLLNQSINNIKEGLENENIIKIRNELGDEFPKCEIYTEEDTEYMKNKTEGTRNYSN